MTLLSPLALLFALAAAVPLLLHLYQRRRRTVMRFSTNRFFTHSIIRSQRRLQLRRWLLLLLRMAACVLLALALAQPIVSLFGGLSSPAGRRDLVIVLDDSLSMRARTGETSRFDRAKALAIAAVDQLVTGDRVAVVRLTGGDVANDPHDQLTDDLPGIRRAIQRMTATQAAGDGHQALQRAAALFVGAEQRLRHTLILTDGQVGDWMGPAWPQPDHPVNTLLIQVDHPTTDNLVATSLNLSHARATVGQPALATARLTNQSPLTRTAQLVLRVDDDEVARRTVTLPGQSSEAFGLPLVFDQPGEHVVHLSLADATDALPEDNDRFATIDVTDRLAVLLVDAGEPPHVRDTAFYLQAALAAVSTDQSNTRIDRAPADQLDLVNLDNYRVVMLCDIATIDQDQASRLRQFAQGGGGLAIVLGTRTDPAQLHATLGRTDGPLGSLLPCRIGGVVEATGGPGPLHLLTADTAHPMLQRFSGPLRGALAGVNVSRAHVLKPRNAWVIGALERDLPLFVERSYGSGRVIVIATALQPDWTNLPTRRVFIPMINRLASYLAGGDERGLRYEVGQPLPLIEGAWDYQRPAHAQVPGGQTVRAIVNWQDAKPRATLEAHHVSQPGIYTAGYQSPDTGTELRHKLAVNVPPRESQTHEMDMNDLAARADRWRLQIVSAAPDDTVRPTTAEADDQPAGATRRGVAEASAEQIIEQSLAGGRASRGIWDRLLWAALIVVIIEPLIANHLFARRQAARQGEFRLRSAA